MIFNLKDSDIERQKRTQNEGLKPEQRLVNKDLNDPVIGP